MPCRTPTYRCTFSVLLNIVSGAHVTDKERLWGFVRRYRPDATPENHPDLDRLIGYAVRYYLDFVAPHQVFRAPTEQEAAGMARLIERLRALAPTADPETIQYEFYEAGKDVGFTNLRAVVPGALRVSARPLARPADGELRRRLRRRRHHRPARASGREAATGQSDACR